MIDKQQIVVDLLNERLPQTKVGIIVKGVDSIDADKIIASVAKSTGQYIYAAAVGNLLLRRKYTGLCFWRQRQ